MGSTIPPLELGPDGEMPKIIGVAKYMLRGSELDSIPSSNVPLLQESEQKIIEHILEQPDIFVWFFDFMLSASLGPRPRRRQLEILCCTRRSDVGLDPSEKPGDFDIVMMPTLEDKYYPQQIMALEVKILRLPAKNRNVHVRPSGAAQAKGLLRDGFPFVGMLHVIIPEPSPREQWKSLEQYVLVNDNLEAQHIGRVPADTIGPDTIRRHFGRMKRYVAETPIGAKAVSLVLDETGRKIIGRDVSNLEIQPEPNSAFDAGLMKRFCDIAAAVKRARG